MAEDLRSGIFLKKYRNIIGVAIIFLLVVAYSFIILPQQQKRVKEKEAIDSFSMKQECQRAGEKNYQADVKSLAGKGIILVPEYAYNKTLNTCLYFSGYIDKDYINKWVKDSFTNKEIISFIQYGKQVIGDTNDHFEVNKLLLFSGYATGD